MELNDSAIKQLGIRWDALAEYKITAGAGPFSWNQDVSRDKSRTDSLGYKDNRSSVDKIDQRYDSTGNPIDGGTPVRSITDTIEIGRNATTDIKDEFTKTITEKQAAILNVDTLQVVLSALKRTDGVSVVSNPKMIVANGATNAFFRVGSREPIIKKTLETGDQNSPGDKYTSELDTGIATDYIKGGYLHTGIELKVVPTVKTDNLIEALIEPSLRRKTDEKVIYNAEGQVENSWPIISVKEIKTRFTLESGQTVAIGGLTDTSQQKVVTKVPLLGDIPLLGKYLFSHTKDEKKQTETIIFVTLKIANPRNLDPNEAIPDHARLVRKRMIHDKVEKYNLDKEIEELNRAAEREMSGAMPVDSKH
jgi:type II secretory pathway component GspD/PulD (secretin)